MYRFSHLNSPITNKYCFKSSIQFVWITNCTYTYYSYYFRLTYFSTIFSVLEGKSHEDKGVLTIENIAPQDGGNYTCSLISNQSGSGVRKKIIHQVFVITVPTYTISAPIVYHKADICSSSDIKIMAQYFSNAVSSILCGSSVTVCTAETKNITCMYQVRFCDI